MDTGSIDPEPPTEDSKQQIGETARNFSSFYRVVILSILAWLLIVPVIVWQTDPDAQTVYASRTWPTTDGHVDNVEVFHDAAPRPRGSTVVVTYHYAVNGNQFDATQQRFLDHVEEDTLGSGSRYSRFDAEQIANRFAKDSTVKVWYNQANNSLSYIDNDLSFSTFANKMTKWTWYLLIAIGAYVAISNFTRFSDVTPNKK